MRSKKIQEIHGYENCKINYIVFENGTVYSPIKKGFLKPSKDTKGYLCIDLRRQNCKRKYPKIHRLVAEAFIPNPNNKPQINHIDGNKENNCVSNLEWCDNLYNMLEAVRIGLKNEYHGKLYQFDLEGNFLNCFSNPSEAAKAIGKKGYGNNITRCIHGHRKTSYGYIWKSEEQVQRLSQACEYTQVGGNGENPTYKKED